jgi:Carboxypeptidase regulatory-like domain/TonB dependent receptor
MIKFGKIPVSDCTGQCERLSKPKSIYSGIGRWFALAAILLCAVPAALAQLTTATILGTITDPTGANIPNASVTLLNLDTQARRTATSTSDGNYNFTLLPVGRYTVTVKASGFKITTTSPLSVEAGDDARDDIKMELGGEAQTVTVESQTPLLQADSATVSSTVTAKAVQDLPLNGRNFVNLVALVPGANPGLGNGLSSGGRPDDRRTNAAGLSVNGQDESLNDWTVDGIDDNERIIGTIGVKPNVEGIQEITVETNSYAAEAGRTAGGVINIVTKSGTNQFHGTAYEFFRNDITDARSVFETVAQGPKPELRQNQYGGSFGGPIFKNRTFFFGDYEGFRQVAGVTYTGTVPTIAEYDDINSLNGSAPQDLFIGATGGEATATAANINPLMLNYLKLFPAPTNSGMTSNFVISPNKTQNYNTADAQIDHSFNSNNHLMARFSYNNVATFTPPQFGTVNGVQISGGEYNYDGPAVNKAYQYELNYTHIFTPSLLLDLVAAYTRINNTSDPLNYGKNVDTSVIGFPSTMTDFSPYANALTPISSVGPFGNIGDGFYLPIVDLDSTYQYAGTVSWTKGNHSFKFGGSLIRRQDRNVQSADAPGAYTFNPESDGDPSSQLQQQNNQLASTLLGAFTSEARTFNLYPPDYRSWEPSGFAQDSWKATPKLTMLLGVRYDVFTPFTEAHNHISNFDYLQALSDTPSTVSSALKIAGVNGVSGTAGIHTYHDDVAPRIGFAYSVTPTTVLRGGYGLSYFPGNYTSNADLKNAPFTSVYSPACQSTEAVQLESSQNTEDPGTLPTGQNPDCATAAGGNNPGAISSTEAIPAPSAPTAAQVANISTIAGLSFEAEAPNFKNALIQQFNLQVEQQFGANVLTIGYVGNIGQHLPETINNINQPLPYNPFAPDGSATNPVNGVRPLTVVDNLTNLSGVSYLQSEGISNYNSLQTSFQRRFTKGLAMDVNYTWEKALNDITGFSQEGNQGWSNALPTNIRATEYGTSEDEVRNRFALSANYQFQYGKEWHGIKKQALAGWEANAIWVWESGKPFSIVESGSGADDPIGDNPADPKASYGYTNRAVPQNSGGSDRPDTIGNTHLAHKTLTEFFNIAAFAPQPLGTIGNTQRNSMTGPDFRDADASIFKDFPVTGRVSLQFRVEVFNISNTPNFGIINNNSANQQFGNAAFGTVSATDPNYTPRELQFALKVQF